jgi:hypothetical protein
MKEKERERERRERERRGNEVTDTIVRLLQVFLACVLRAVHLHGDLLRAAVLDCFIFILVSSMVSTA